MSSTAAKDRFQGYAAHLHFLCLVDGRPEELQVAHLYVVDAKADGEHVVVAMARGHVTGMSNDIRSLAAEVALHVHIVVFSVQHQLDTSLAQAEAEIPVR